MLFVLHLYGALIRLTPFEAFSVNTTYFQTNRELRRKTANATWCFPHFSLYPSPLGPFVRVPLEHFLFLHCPDKHSLWISHGDPSGFTSQPFDIGLTESSMVTVLSPFPTVLVPHLHVRVFLSQTRPKIGSVLHPIFSTKMQKEMLIGTLSFLV